MSKVTSKLQVTLPKAIADQYKIRPGDEIAWAAAGEFIRVSPRGQPPVPADREARLHWFDLATDRHRKRRTRNRVSKDRGWKREDLYARGRSR